MITFCKVGKAMKVKKEWAKLELECLLMIFIYFNSTFKVTWKTPHFKCQYIITHTEEKPSKITNITFASLLFYQPSWGLWNLRIKSPSRWNDQILFKDQIPFKMIHSTPKNAKYSVSQSQVCFLHITHLGIRKYWLSVLEDYLKNH